MSLEKAIESQIQEAMAAGAFDNLPGAGKPQEFTLAEQLAGDNWLGFKMLQNGGMVPVWLDAGREIEKDLERLQRIDDNHASLCAQAARHGHWDAFRPSIARARERYEELARQVRKKQDRFNNDAPGPRTQRPALWVEYHLERLDRRVLG
ncbi:MAG TPA: DUF1992 domain-containing protein [Tepidiformaceae bacterium]|nr:DUF1992 domain-containing protein [Tepidiformaceae bacterium]HMO96074.1 DUF1992 domain-containing protein [Tepidiformaceae bacterium]